MLWNTRIAATCLALLLGLPGVALALPNQMTHEGLVYDADGLAITGAHDIAFRVYAVAAGGQPVFSEVHHNVEFSDGYFAIAVGSETDGGIPGGLFAAPELYVSIAVDGGAELAPRLPLLKVPAAMHADVAVNVTGDITPRSVTISGAGPVIDAQGRWVGDPTGLRGPAGPQGPQGIQGPAGAAGAAGGDADPAAVVPLVVQAVQNDPNLLPYVRDDIDDSKAGNLELAGGRLQLTGGSGRNALELNNNNIVGVNLMRFQDPGPNEGISWDGTQARIMVSPLDNANADGWLRLVNDEGITLEATDIRVVGNLTVTGWLRVLGELTVDVMRVITLHVTNANVTNLNGPNNRVNVTGELALNRNVILGNGVAFIGTLNAGAVVSASTIAAASNISAGGSIAANGNLSAGGAGRITTGTGGYWVGNTQVVDGNGNVLRTPPSVCPAGSVLQSTNNLGQPTCASLTCPAGSSVRGLNANGTPVCEDDSGIAAIPPNSCPAGQALVSINAAGATACRAVGGVAGASCAPPTYMVGFDAQGNVECSCTADGHCAANQYCNVAQNRCAVGCRSDANCAANQYCNANHQCVAGCRLSPDNCPNLQWCDNHSCRNGCKSDAECGNNVCQNHLCVPRGVKITGDREGYGHHGACSGWNSCGSAATCARWACNIRGYGTLISYGWNGPCTSLRICHLFYSGCCGGIQWNWGNWCSVYGVTDIVCQ